MSEMDWETSPPAFTPQRGQDQARCPYRTSNEIANPFHYGSVQTPPPGPNLAYPGQRNPHAFWEPTLQQNLPSPDTMSNRFPSNQPGFGFGSPLRAPDISSFGYQIGVDTHSQPSSQTRHSRFEGSPSLVQRRGYQPGTHGMPGSGAIITSNSNQPTPAVSDLSSYHLNHPTMAGRNTNGGTVSQENRSPAVLTSPSRYLPPITSLQTGAFPDHPTHYARRTAFSGELSGSNTAQSKIIQPQYILEITPWKEQSVLAHRD
jgi:hypothetical protein